MVDAQALWLDCSRTFDPKLYTLILVLKCCFDLDYWDLETVASVLCILHDQFQMLHWSAGAAKSHCGPPQCMVLWGGEVLQME